MKKDLFLILLVALAQSEWARADGLPFKGNRYDGPVTVIRMTPEQVTKTRQGRLNEKPTRDIQLNRMQKMQLQRATGFSPDTIEVWTLEEAVETCSCELLNFGICMGPDLIQIPHSFLGETDEDRGKFASQVQRSNRRHMVSGVLAVLALFFIGSIFLRSLRARPRLASEGLGELRAAS